MPIMGQDPRRAELPGAPHLAVVSVLWVQRAYNGWAERASRIAEDGIFGDQTLLALNRLAQRLAPASLTITPTEDRRSVIIDRALEQKIAGLLVQPRDGTPVRSDGTTDLVPGTQHPITDAGEGYITRSSSGPELWMIALGIGAFAASFGLVYAATTVR